MAATEDDFVFPQKPIRVMSREPCEEDREIMTHTVFGLLILLSIVLLLIVYGLVSSGKDATTFSMELAGFEGLNATLGRTLSPVFHLKVHVENPSIFQPLCYNGGEVVVSYSDVALAWGHVPRFCVQSMLPTEFLVLPWGRGVGLSEDLRGRLTSDWRTGKAQVTVELKVFYDDKVRSQLKYDGAISHSFQLSLGDEHQVN